MNIKKGILGGVLLIALTFNAFAQEASESTDSSSQEKNLGQTTTSTRDFDEDGNIDRRMTTVLFDGDRKVETVVSDGDDDGTMDLRLTVITQNGQKVYNESRWLSDKYAPTGTGSRLYLSEGKIVVGEYDTDGDGHYELLVIYSSEEIPTTVIERSPEGGLIPLDPESWWEEVKEGPLGFLLE